MKLNWGKSIVLFFIVFIALSISFVVFSLRQHNDLVDDDYYEQGANYTSVMDVKKRSLTFADSVIVVDADSIIEVIIASGLVANMNNLSLHFFCPSDKRNDFKTKWPVLANSLHIDKKQLIKGRYIVKMKWESNNLPYYLEKDLMVK